MSTENGTSVADPTSTKDLTRAIADSIAGALHGTATKGVRTPAPSEAPSWTAFAGALDQLVAASPELKSAIEESMARSARQALAFGDGPLPSTDDFLAMLRRPPTLGKGGTFASVFWWGFNIQVSHEDLNIFLATAVPLTAITATLSASFGGPAAPWIAAAAAFIAGMLALLKALDRGRGVYISMSWFAPGVFIPTSV